MRGNVVRMVLTDGRLSLPEPLYQWDYGQRIVFDGVELPETYEVHFSNSEFGESKTRIGNADGVDIPDEYLTTGKNIYVWLYLHDGESDGETVYRGVISVQKRAEPTNEQPTPVQQSEITQAIAALNIAVNQCEESVEHYPKVVNGNWYVWDAEQETWVDTDVPATGPQGATGETGATGATPNLTVGTVSTGAPGSQAVVTITGTAENPVLNMTIPRGDPGELTEADVATVAETQAMMNEYDGGEG